MDCNQAQNPLILDKEKIERLLPQIDVLGVLRDMFKTLSEGQAVQPPQQLVTFPEGAGDFINYLGVLNKHNVYGIKTSPYLVQKPKALVTAWTLLMSMKTGRPLLLTDAGQLTIERTAGATALAIDYLAPKHAKRLAVIGTGQIARAHIRYATPLREWSHISVYSLDIAQFNEDQRRQLQTLDPRITLHTNIQQALKSADVVMLCTSSGTPVMQPDSLDQPALITSISTNVFQAHEVPPQSLLNMDVYCDYKATTPQSAGDMVIAAKDYNWSSKLIKGDLPSLTTGTATLPDYTRHAFFRSIGLGLEDVAIAHALFNEAQNI